MTSTRYTVAGVVSLVGGGLAILLQYLVTPLSDGNVEGAELLDTVAAHHTAMGWALALDVPMLLAAPAVLFIGGLAGMRTSKLAAAATVLLFFPMLMSLPPVVGFDGLAYFAAAEPNRTAMVHLVETWQSSAYFAIGLFPYVVCQVVGSVMMAVAPSRPGRCRRGPLSPSDSGRSCRPPASRRAVGRSPLWATWCCSLPGQPAR
jgi:hypothetical protein